MGKGGDNPSWDDDKHELHKHFCDKIIWVQRYKNFVYLAECPCFLKGPWEKEKDRNRRDVRNKTQETWRAVAHKLFPVSAGDEGNWRSQLNMRNFSSLWGFNDIGNVGQKNISSSIGFYKTETTKWEKRRWLHED